MPEATMVEAINMALARAMEGDPRVVILGEDVGIDGGVFRATDGLLARFGKDRVMDTPISEASICGMSVGLSAQGFVQSQKSSSWGSFTQRSTNS